MLMNLILAMTVCSVIHSERPSEQPLRSDPQGIVKEVFNPKANKALYGQWRSSKLGGGGYIMNVVQNHIKPDTLYAYSDVGGIFRTDDSGRNWYMIHGNTGPQSLDCVRGLLVDPDNPDILVAAVGYQWGKQQGIFRSIDGGKSWKKTLDCQVFGNGNGRGSGLIMQRSPVDKNLLYIAPGPDGVFVSHDGGIKWQSLGMKNLYIDDFKIDRANPKRLFICAIKRRMFQKKTWTTGKYLDLKGGFFSTNDAGKTWTEISDHAPKEMLQSPVDSKRWYAIFDSRYFKYTDDLGKSWHDDSKGLKLSKKKPEPHNDEYYLALGAGPDFLLIGSGAGTFYIKKPLNSKWRKVPYKRIQGPWFARSAPGKWEHFGRACASIVVDQKDPKHWFFTDWYSLYQTWDSGKNWTLTMDGIENTVIHTVTQVPNDPGTVHMGMADNGLFRSSDGADSFKQITSASNNCKAIAIAPSNPKTIYALGPKYHGWYSNWLFASIDGGQNFSRSPMLNIPRGKKSEYRINSICIDAINPKQVYIGVSGKIVQDKGGVWKSVNRGGSWTWDSKGLPQNKSFFQTSVWDNGHQLARSRNGAMVTIDRKNVYYRKNDKDAWHISSFKGAGKPQKIVQVLTSPELNGVFYIAQSYGGLWKSVDNGKSWKKILDKGVHFATVDMANNKRLAVALDKAEGIMLSIDGGLNWKMLDGNIPQRQRLKMAFAGNRLVVGTPGNGVFYLPLDEAAKKAVTGKKLASSIGRNILKYGSCEKAPKGWYSWVGNGKIGLSKESEGLYSGAGLKITATGSKVSGSVSLPFYKRGQLLVSGYVSCIGDKPVNIALQCFDKNGKQTAWMNVTKINNNGKKMYFKQVVKIPENTSKTNLTLLLSSSGTIRIDEVKAQPIPELFIN